MAILDGGWDPRSDVFVGVGEPLVMYAGVAVDIEDEDGIVVMLDTGIGVLPFVL